MKKLLKDLKNFIKDTYITTEFNIYSTVHDVSEFLKLISYKYSDLISKVDLNYKFSYDPETIYSKLLEFNITIKCNDITELTVKINDSYSSNDINIIVTKFKSIEMTYSYKKDSLKFMDFINE